MRVWIKLCFLSLLEEKNDWSVTKLCGCVSFKVYKPVYDVSGGITDYEDYSSIQKSLIRSVVFVWSEDSSGDREENYDEVLTRIGVYSWLGSSAVHRLTTLSVIKNMFPIITNKKHMFWYRSENGTPIHIYHKTVWWYHHLDCVGDTLSVTRSNHMAQTFQPLQAVPATGHWVRWVLNIC